MKGTGKHSSGMWNARKTKYYYFYGFRAVCRLAGGLLSYTKIF